MIDQAADNVCCTVPRLLLFKNWCFVLKDFRSSINIFFNSLSKRATNLLVDGLLKAFIVQCLCGDVPGFN